MPTSFPNPIRPFRQAVTEPAKAKLREIAQPKDDNVWKARILGGLAGAGEGLIDLVTPGDTDVMPDLTAGLAPVATAIGSKTLPTVAKEAYGAVKGLKGLYSRLTDSIVQQLPAKAMPSKIASVAKSGASAEEIGYRKLNEFLAERNPSTPIAKEEVLAHLDANPIELNVKKLTSPETRAKALGEEFDSVYGPNWDRPRDPEDWATDDFPGLTDVDRQRWLDVHDGVGPDTQYSNYVVPGGTDYQETLIKAPVQDNPIIRGLERTANQKRAEVERLFNESYEAGAAGDPIRADYFRRMGEAIERDEIGPLVRQMEGARINSSYDSPHWDGEPNVLVHSRANNRTLAEPPTETQRLNREFQLANLSRDAREKEAWIRDNVFDGEHYDELMKLRDEYAHLAGKPLRTNAREGRFVEEVQSDLHQLGAKVGYTPQEHALKQAEFEAKLEKLREASNSSDPAVVRGVLEQEQRLLPQRYQLEKGPIPNLPFQKSYPDLAIKEQLLEAANDPKAEWFGMSGAETQQLRFPDPANEKGMSFMYDQKHPSILEKLLKPFGGTVEKRQFPMEGPLFFDNRSGKIIAEDIHGVKTQVASEYPRVDSRTGMQPWNHGTGSRPSASADLIEQLNKQRLKVSIPGPDYWYADLTPEMKEAIKLIGFPAMMGLMSTLPQDPNQR